MTTLLLRSHASGSFLHRGRYGNQFEGLSQQDCGVSQSHNPGPANPRTQQGKRSKGRHGDKRARYAGGGVPVQPALTCCPSITSAFAPAGQWLRFRPPRCSTARLLVTSLSQSSSRTRPVPPSASSPSTVTLRMMLTGRAPPPGDHAFFSQSFFSLRAPSLSSAPSLQPRDEPAAQRHQLCDGSRLARLRLVHQQPPEPPDQLPIRQVHRHRHALGEEPIRRELGSQSFRSETLLVVVMRCCRVTGVSFSPCCFFLLPQIKLRVVPESPGKAPPPLITIHAWRPANPNL